MPLLPALSRSSTSLQQFLCRNAADFTGKRSNIKDIYLQTRLLKLAEILSHFMDPCLYTSATAMLNFLNSCLKLPALFQWYSLLDKEQ